MQLLVRNVKVLNLHAHEAVILYNFMGMKKLLTICLLSLLWGCSNKALDLSGETTIKPGDYVKAGSPLLTLHTDEPERFERALEILDGAISIKEGGTVNRLPLIVERIS